MFKKIVVPLLIGLTLLSSSVLAVAPPTLDLDTQPRKISVDFSKINQITYASYSTKKTALEEFLVPITDSALNISSPKQISSKAEAIVKKANAKTDYQKAKAIYNWVCDNMFYDYFLYTVTLGDIEPNPNNYLSGICEDYANVTAALLRGLGIPCRVVSGYATGDGSSEKDQPLSEYKKYLSHNDSNLFLKNMDPDPGHAWNFAYVDGRWIFMETTWGSGNYISLDTGKWVKRKRTDKYFDMSLKEYSKSHCAKKLDIHPKTLELAVNEIKHSISKDGKETKMRIGTMRPYVYDWAITTNNVRWHSSNEKVVVLDDMWKYRPKTVITANIVGEGTATITCIVGSKKAECKIYVTK